MTHVLIALTDPAKPSLDAELLAELAAVLPSPGEPAWLRSGEAAEIPFSPRLAIDQLLSRLRQRFAAYPVDLAILPVSQRRKKLLLADMDSTMIRQECIDELAAELGLKAHVSAITERAMRGEIPFEAALRERVALLKGLPASIADRLIAERIELTPGGRTLIATMRANGAYTALVSGGFTLFTGPISRKLGFDEHRSNSLGQADGKLDGTVHDPILGAEAKQAALAELTARLGLTPGQAMAVGDGANDLPMLAAAGLGVAFHAKPKVAEAADVRIDHGDLTALLYLQGYRAEELVN